VAREKRLRVEEFFAGDRGVPAGVRVQAFVLRGERAKELGG
jgi:hypothetical protein